MPRGAPKPGSVVIMTDGEGNITEQHAFTCRHCGSPIVVPIGKTVEDVSGGCFSCWGLICVRCAEKGVCTPFLKKIEAMEAKDRSLRSMGLA